MSIFDKFKKNKRNIKRTNENTLSELFKNPKEFSVDENQLLTDSYAEQLNELKNNFQDYKNNSEAIINSVSEMIVRTDITKGAIANFTPFYEERLGFKLGKYIEKPIISDYCRKYHYDRNDRIIMVEEYSTFLNYFMTTEIYLYHDNYAEKLWFSSGVLARLFVFDNAFANTQLSLSFSNNRYGGFTVEKFLYEDNCLREVNIGREDGNYKDVFIYENNKLIMIEQIYPNGNKRIKYTVKKPNFKKIQNNVYDRLKDIICNQNGEFKAIGIEGFLDQQKPDICVCFTANENPGDLIADWNAEMNSIEIYDWQLSAEQEKRCIKTVAEIIVSLVNEGILEGRQIYFHQNQICVLQLYPGVKNLFKKANISVK